MNRTPEMTLREALDSVKYREGDGYTPRLVAEALERILNQRDTLRRAVEFECRMTHGADTIQRLRRALEITE